jgi:putative membrane protein
MSIRVFAMASSFAIVFFPLGMAKATVVASLNTPPEEWLPGMLPATQLDPRFSPGLLDSAAGLPDFLVYFLLAIGLLGVFARLYSWVTPHRELQLLRANNTAAAIAFGGALIGFSLPLASAIRHSLFWLDSLLWGAVALVIQLLVFLVLQWLLGGLSTRIQQGEIAAGTFAAATAIAVGMLNAASMTY